MPDSKFEPLFDIKLADRAPRRDSHSTSQQATRENLCFSEFCLNFQIIGLKNRFCKNRVTELDLKRQKTSLSKLSSDVGI